MSRAEKAKARKALSAKITDAAFFYDPYNGADREDMTAYNNKELQTLAGCYAIIDVLCDMLEEAVRA